MTGDAEARAWEAASDLAFVLGNRFSLDDDCRTAINQAFLAFAAQETAAVSQQAENTLADRT